MNYPIKYNVTPPSKIFEVNELEEKFFECLYSKIPSNIILYRMSDGTLSVEWCGCPVGKIKLQGKKYHMQVLKSLYKTESIDGTLDCFIPKIDCWVEYIAKHLNKLKEGQNV